MYLIVYYILIVKPLFDYKTRTRSIEKINEYNMLYNIFKIIYLLIIIIVYQNIL